MTPDEFKRALRKRPFKPLRVSLSSGRVITISHPEVVEVLPESLYVVKAVTGETYTEWELVALNLVESVTHVPV